MKITSILSLFCIYFLLIFSTFNTCCAQNTLKGKLKDSNTGDPLIGATVLIKGSSHGTTTDYDGAFNLKSSDPIPLTLVVQYSGYATKEVVFAVPNQFLDIELDEEIIQIDAVEIKGHRIADKQKSSPLTIESMDQIAIRETPAVNFYDGLGALKDVDLTAASLGFKIINTRGFNSTSPVRSLQIIDGVDNQAPGLNFSLGNFLGASELDVNKVDLIVGASSAFYGPNAFNGVISMETRNPFIQKGLSASVKIGERSLVEGAVRFADAFKNKSGHENFAYKLNFFFLKAHDWEAKNYSPVQGQRLDSVFENYGLQNPGGYDKVNVYGDEYYTLNDLTTLSSYFQDPGLRRWYRPGYREIDLVDYNSKNYKASAALHFRLQPSKKFESPELFITSSFGSGTTVYQGDNRFSLKNILFFQNRIEIKKEGKYFIRAYATNEDAGDSYDPYFTAIRLQEQNKNSENWATDYRRYWKLNISPLILKDDDYPKLVYDPITNTFAPFEYDKANKWLRDNIDSLTVWHHRASVFADTTRFTGSQESRPYAIPGTKEFQLQFDSLTQAKSNTKEGGTKFYDKSALYHLQGEYKWETNWMDQIVAGVAGRLYRPISDGTIFYDSSGTVITNYEYGFYTGLTKKFFGNHLVTNGALRVDKGENFDYIYTPAISLVYSPRENMYLRLSFSSAIRNPTLTDQYLHLNVGRAILAGNIHGVDSLITVESFIKYLDNKATKLTYFDIDGVQPEKVKTFEVGFRSSFFTNLYLDMGYYFSTYNNFLGYNIGIKARFEAQDPTGLPRDVQAYRYAANSTNTVQTHGFSIGVNQYFWKNYALSGNYSFNKLIKTVDTDPIIPAFNTPEHKYNINVSGRDLVIKMGSTQIRNLGFSVNYKWVQGFLFEGSPQFTGDIESYNLMDAQVNWLYKKINTTFKLGASNILDNQHYETYGGPLIGRLAYFSLLYEFKN